MTKLESILPKNTVIDINNLSSKEITLRFPEGINYNKADRYLRRYNIKSIRKKGSYVITNIDGPSLEIINDAIRRCYKSRNNR